MLARTPHPTSSGVATAVAFAFLAAEEWTKAGLVQSGTELLGVRRRWLPPLAAQVLGWYPRPPVDAARELAAVVEGCPAFVDAVDRAARQRVPIRIARYVLAPGQARQTPVPIPRISSAGDLADLLELTSGELDWFADVKHWNGRAEPRLQHYRYVWRTRSGRTPRLLEIPAPRLRALQRTVVRSILAPIPLHDAAHGFVSGRSAVTGARLHTGAQMVIALDLRAFFARVTAGKVFGILRLAGYSESVAHILTGLCTHEVPPRVLSRMPPGGAVDERFALRQALSLAHLPQGAPTSPMLANLAVRRLDSRLSGWAGAAGAVYTRYADDLAFSGGKELAGRADAFVRGAARIVGEEGHSLNPRKSRIRAASVRQVVTGIVVNGRTNVTRAEFDRLKAVLHNCVLHGPAGQNRDGHGDFRAHLLGRIAWLEALNPGRGARLRADFARIRW